MSLLSSYYRLTFVWVKTFLQQKKDNPGNACLRFVEVILIHTFLLGPGSVIPQSNQRRAQSSRSYQKISDTVRRHKGRTEYEYQNCNIRIPVNLMQTDICHAYCMTVFCMK